MREQPLNITQSPKVSGDPLADKKEVKKMAGLLIAAGLFMGVGVGLLVTNMTGNNVTGATTTIGLGLGFIASFIYQSMNK